MNELIAKLQEMADQYPEDPAAADAIVRCAAAGIPLDGVMAMAIRERLLSEVRRLREGGAPMIETAVALSRWECGDVALDKTDFVWRRYEVGWRTVPRTEGVQYSDEDIERHLGPLVRLIGVPAQADSVGHVPIDVAAELRANPQEFVRDQVDVSAEETDGDDWSESGNFPSAWWLE